MFCVFLIRQQQQSLTFKLSCAFVIFMKLLILLFLLVLPACHLHGIEKGSCIVGTHVFLTLKLNIEDICCIADLHAWKENLSQEVIAFELFAPLFIFSTAECSSMLLEMWLLASISLFRGSLLHSTAYQPWSPNIWGGFQSVLRPLFCGPGRSKNNEWQLRERKLLEDMTTASKELGDNAILTQNPTRSAICLFGTKTTTKIINDAVTLNCR